MRKTALLTGVAGLLLMTAPAFAQDTAPQTPPPADEAQTPPPAQNLTLTPGAAVKGSDGAELGRLEGARNTPAGQELTVRGADGQLRAVPVAGGVSQNGADIVVGWTEMQFQSAPAISESATPAPAEPMTPPTTDPSAEPQPTDPAMAPSTDQPPTPGEAETPTPNEPDA